MPFNILKSDLRQLIAICFEMAACAVGELLSHVLQIVCRRTTEQRRWIWRCRWMAAVGRYWWAHLLWHCPTSASSAWRQWSAPSAISSSLAHLAAQFDVVIREQSAKYSSSTWRVPIWSSHPSLIRWLLQVYMPSVDSITDSNFQRS